jgi:hypothetical protein
MVSIPPMRPVGLEASGHKASAIHHRIAKLSVLPSHIRPAHTGMRLADAKCGAKGLAPRLSQADALVPSIQE